MQLNQQSLSNEMQPRSPMMIGADPQQIFGGNMLTAPQSNKYLTVSPNIYRDRNTGEKIKIAFYLTVVFLILSLQGTYRIANTTYNAFTSNPYEFLSENGNPTIKGMVIFAVFFFLFAMFMLM